MLKNTFCHIPGIGLRLESVLWRTGIASWDVILNIDVLRLPFLKKTLFCEYVHESFKHYKDGNAKYFSEKLPKNQCWRLFPDFRDSLAYIDIETTGFGGNGNYITTIALYDGISIYYYVNGKNLDDFKKDITNFKSIVTYNGRCFDVPFIENYFNIKLDHMHIDLRYILKNLGYTGGLKGCERRLGLDRKELNGLDGYFAVLLWEDFKRNKNQKALETLLAYNIQDVVSLETLMVYSYNLSLKDTPFLHSHKIPLSSPPMSPFNPDIETIKRITDNNRNRFRYT